MTTRKKTEAHEPAAVVEQPTVEAAPDGLAVTPAAPEAPVPVAAPLDPPAPAPAPEAAPDGFVTSVATGVMLAEHTAQNVPLSIIIDANTGEPPAVDGLFEAVTPTGSAQVCTKRLVQRVHSSSRSDDYLLLPQGAHLSGDEAARLTAIITQQGTAGLPL